MSSSRRPSQPLDPAAKASQRRRKLFFEILATLCGWVLIAGGVSLVTYWIKTAPPKGELVCTHPRGTVPLNKWGTCKLKQD